MSKTYLLTGGTGFLGSLLSIKLIKKGDNLGNAFLCTKFHVYPETGYGNILKQSLENILNSQKVETINQEVYDGQHECRKCQWVNSCGGGCSFIRYALHKKFNAPFMYCGARKTLFQHIRKRIFKKETD